MRRSRTRGWTWALTTLNATGMCVAGHTYERVAIERWLAQHNTSPLTGHVLLTNAVIANHRLRAIVESYHTSRVRAIEQQQQGRYDEAASP